MKPAKLVRFVVSILVCSLAARAADFEGTLKWSFKVEVTDPKMKQQMADAQKQMADPEKLAQMKATLENPQMKAMMAQNPQMKAAMEAQIKMAEDAISGKGGGDMMSAMMPKGITLRTKGGRTHLLLEGGAMPMEAISRQEPLETTIIDRNARTFSKVPTEKPKTEAAVSHKVTKTAATAKILGYTCEQYLIEATEQGQKMTGIVWATDDIPGLNASSLAQTNFGGGENSTFMQEIKGAPLKMEMKLPQMKVVVEATAIQAGAIADGIFEIPAGFTEKPYGLGAPATPGLPK